MKKFQLYEKSDREMLWYVPVLSTHKKNFLCPSWISWQDLRTLTNTNALSLSLKRIKKKNNYLHSYLLSYHLPLPNVSYNSFHHLSFLKLHFSKPHIWNQICLLRANHSEQARGLTSNSSSCHFVITHVVSFPVRHQTSSIKEEQLSRMLLHKGLPSFLFPFKGCDSIPMGSR